MPRPKPNAAKTPKPSKPPTSRARAAAPKDAAKPQRQRAATPRRSTPRRTPGQARQLPPLTADLVEHFGGQDHLELIVSECVPPDAMPGDVLRLLLEARRLQADPIRRDVYLTPNRSRDGAGTEYSVAARRDCLLAYARRQPTFIGHDEAPIFEHDSFKRGKPNATAATLAERAGIEHETGMPGKRGEVVGAWCVAQMRNEDPVVRILDAAEYVGTPEERLALDPDDPKRTHPDLCMVAAAMCNCLRIAAGLNDVVGADELTRRPEPLPDLSEPVAPAIFDDGPRDELDARILDAYTQAQALDPLLWPPAKLRARLASAFGTPGTPDDPKGGYNYRRGELAAEIEHDVAAEVTRRRDPVANARRLDELRAFDPSTLDAEDLAAYQAELAAVEAAVDAAAAA